MERLSNEFKQLKDEYLSRHYTSNQKDTIFNNQILQRCSDLEENYEIGLK